MANDVKLQEGHPVDENLRPLKVGGKSTAIETAQHGDGAKINGDLTVTGTVKGKTDITLTDDIACDDITCDDITCDDITADVIGGTRLNIDKEHSDTDAITLVGTYVDIDKTGASTSDNTIYGAFIDLDNPTATNGTNNMYGVYCTPTLTHAADAGTAGLYGYYLNATGGTNGASYIYGCYLHVTGSDVNYGLVIRCEDGGNDLRILSTANVADYFQISTIEDGETTLTTFENGGGSTAHLNMVADGNFTVDAVGDITLDAAGDDILMKGSAGNGLNFEQHHTGDWDIQNLTDDKSIIFEVQPGGTPTEVFRIQGTDEGAAIALFSQAAVFIRGSNYTDATNVTVDFRDSSNKAHLDMTGGSISGTLTLKFPNGSGNFVLVVQQDSSARTIAAYAVQDSAGNAADNDGGTAGKIRWQGGDSAGSNAPDLTDGGNKRDILSFYWDSIEEVCYGIASLNF